MTVLFQPSQIHLPAYVKALEQGWEPVITGPLKRDLHLTQAAQDPDAFLNSLTDLKGEGFIEQFDGSFKPRLPSRTFWIMNGADFAGTLSLRWQPGTPNLPNWVHGHIGWHVLPDFRGKNLAPKALTECLPIAKDIGLPFLDLAIKTNNTASIRAAEKCGATFLSPYPTDPNHPLAARLGRWRLWI